MNAQLDTYDRILHAARELIHGRSYAEVGVAAICEQAKVKKGSFYHFFPSKQALTLAVLDTYFVDMKEKLLDPAFRREFPPLERLQRVCQLAYEIHHHIKELSGHVVGCPLGNLALELSTQDEVIRKKLNDIFEKLQTAMHQTLEEAVATGALPPMNVTATARAMFAYFEGVILLAKTHNDLEILRQLLPAMTQIHIPPQA